MRSKIKSNLTSEVILLSAAGRRSGAVLPLPGDADPASPKVITLLSRLLAQGLIEERRTAVADHAWRSDDAGKHWAPVVRQWTGRAVLVRTPQPVEQDRAAPVSQVSTFELVNDNLQTWVSADGRNWIPLSMPLQK